MIVRFHTPLSFLLNLFIIAKANSTNGNGDENFSFSFFLMYKKKRFLGNTCLVERINEMLPFSIPERWIMLIIKFMLVNSYRKKVFNCRFPKEFNGFGHARVSLMKTRIIVASICAPIFNKRRRTSSCFLTWMDVIEWHIFQSQQRVFCWSWKRLNYSIMPVLFHLD